MSVNLSAAQILNFIQCPRRFWLEQYHPEHEGDVAPMDACLDAEEAVDAQARASFSDVEATRINGRLGLRKAIELTSASLAHGTVVLDATFEFEGISTQIDVLDWCHEPYRAISVSAASEPGSRHLDDCALQAWTMRRLGLPEHRFLVAFPHDNTNAEDAFERKFTLLDVSEQIAERIDRLDATVAAARTTHAALAEPRVDTGPQCHLEYPCPFLEYCGQ